MAMAASEIDRNVEVVDIAIKSSPDVSMAGSEQEHSQALGSCDVDTPVLTTETSIQAFSTASLHVDIKGESDNDLEELVEIDDNSLPSIIEDICPVDRACVQCEIEQSCSFRFTDNEETLYVCNEHCLKAYQAEYPGKYTVTRKKYIIEEITPKTLLCSECEQKKTCYFYHNFDGEDSYYCSLDCLEDMMADEKDKFVFKHNNVLKCIDQIRSTEGQCLICEKVKPCEFSLVRYGETRFLCERTCIKILCKREGGRYYIKNLRVSEPAVSNSIDKNLVEGYKIQAKAAAMVQREQSFHRRCSQCTLILIVDENVLTWEAMDFCDERCLERFQNGIGSRCAKCNTLVQRTSLGKYCVRFGYDIRQFCNSSCLDEFKKVLKICCYCQRNILTSAQVFLAPVDDKRQYKHFCSQSCVEKFDQRSNSPEPEPVWAKCAVCSLEKATTIEMELTETASQQICSDPCFAAYKFVNNSIPDQCKWCKKYFERKPTKSFTTYDDSNPNCFCSLSCITIHMHHTRFIVSCNWCQSQKYNFDMIRRVDNDQAVMMCSLHCLSLYKESANAQASSNGVSPPTLDPSVPSVEQGGADVMALAAEQLITLTRSRKRRQITPSLKQEKNQRNESAKKIRLVIPDSPRSGRKMKTRRSRNKIARGLGPRMRGGRRGARGARSLPSPSPAPPAPLAAPPAVAPTASRRSSRTRGGRGGDRAGVGQRQTIATEQMNIGASSELPEGAPLEMPPYPDGRGTLQYNGFQLGSWSSIDARHLHRSLRAEGVSNIGSEEEESDDDEDEPRQLVPRGLRLFIEADEDSAQEAGAACVLNNEPADDLPLNPPEVSDDVNGEMNGPLSLLDFNWRTLPIPPISPQLRREEFVGSHGPTTSPTLKPYEIFEKIWDRPIMEEIARQTNLYAQQYAKHLLEQAEMKPTSRIVDWKDTDVDELYIYFAIVMAMGITIKPHLAHYWTTDLNIFSTPGFATYMSLRRFQLLSRCLHFSDNSECPPNLTRSEAKISKIKPIVDHLNSKFQALYGLGQNIALDESLTQWKGCLDIKQYISNKASKVGIKTYEVCDSRSGYLWGFEIHSGGESETPEAVISGSIPNLVLRLLQGLENRGHTVWMDSFYNSPALARILKTKGFDCVGTLRPYWMFVPKEIVNLKKSGMRVGQVCGYTSGDVDVMVWRDRKNVAMISTYHGTAVSDGKPTLIKDYNVYMGGVDKKDQMVAMYPLERTRTQVWYKKFFKRLLNVSILNAYIIHKHNVQITHRAFRMELTVGLLQRYEQSNVALQCVTVRELPRFSAEVRTHFPVQFPPCPGDRSGNQKRLCVVCKSKRSQVKCNACNVALCFNLKSTSSCYISYHT